MVGWMGRTALELVGQAGLGYSFDPLVRDKADEYGAALKAFMYGSFFGYLFTASISLTLPIM